MMLQNTQHYSNIHDAKTHLSQLLQYAERGDEVVIGRAGKPVARLVPIKLTTKPKRIAGTLAGKLKIADDFDEMPDWFMDYFK